MNERVRRVELLARTVVHLRPAQVVHRARLRAERAALARVPEGVLRRAVRSRAAPACPGWPAGFTCLDEIAPEAGHSAEDIARFRFRFLEETRDLGNPPDWHQASASRLWRYHLHYFEWAWAFATHADRQWARDAFAPLWRSWRRGTAVARGDAWSPYVVSLRAWAMCGVHAALVDGSALHAQWIDDLSVHAAYLRSQVEQDVGGNHLVKNLKALIGLGVFLGDDRMVVRAGRRLQRQLPLQVLADGGHFERSPSYHCQVLADLLDVHALLAAAGATAVAGLDDAIGTMRAWLGALRMPDGDIPLFNDCSLVGRRRIDALGPTSPPDRPFLVLEPSGYCVLRPNDRIHLVVDVGPPCPPDLPAHAHADCLSFELAVDGRRLVVDTGTSTYEPGARRAFERSTAAHNTVEVDGADQTEVWGAFRAARLAQPRLESARVAPAQVEIVASHDGYERLGGRVRHRRTLRVNGGGVELIDEVSGRGTHRIAARVHVAPDLRIVRHADGSLGLGPVRLSAGGEGTHVELTWGEVATGFGQCVRNQVVEISREGTLPLVIRTTLTLDPRSERRAASTIGSRETEGGR